MLDYGEFLKILRSDRVRLMTKVSNNTCQSFDDYRYLCGKLRGLQEAEDLFQEITERMMNPQKNKNEEQDDAN